MIDRTAPRYWTAALWEKTPDRGLVWRGYMPAVNASWGKFVTRLQDLPPRYQYRTFYWDGAKWTQDFNSVVGADRDFATLFPGWNVWSVYQVKDLGFDPLMLGVSRDRQLRIWVEDQLRLHAPGSLVADPFDLKGGQVEILPSRSATAGLSVLETKEDVGGPALTVEGPAELRYVRFFNRSAEKSALPWPHDRDYLLGEVFQPNAAAPATSGPGPSTITTTVTTPIAQALTPALWIAGVVGVLLIARELRK